MTLVRTIVLTALGLSLVSPSYAQQAKPVMIGGEESLDACGGLGDVVGLDPDGDNFLSVRAGPSSKNREIARLHEGDQFFWCDEPGNWIGIVFGRGTCGVTSPVAKRKAYKGGCKSGWVHSRYARLIAG